MGKGKGTLFGKPKDQVIKHPGAFREKAKKAGMSTAALAEKATAPGSKASAATKKQAVLAENLMAIARKRMHGAR